MRPHRIVSLALLAAAAACGSSHHDGGCNTADPNACSGDDVCEPVSGGQPACFAPVVVKGQVTSTSGAPVEGARVVALDANRAPASAVAITDASGSFTLSVPATRAGDGAPVSAAVTLRADARNFQSFPGGLRTALPIDLSAAARSGGSGPWIAQGPLTAVKLVPLADTTALMSIGGSVTKPPSRVGVLVVATPAATPTSNGVSAIADQDGRFEIFNVPGAASPGKAYTVGAYGQGLNYETADVTLTLGTTGTAVILPLRNATTATINGGLIFVSGATTPTSVSLVVKSTYVAALDRGESPPGLVAQVPSGSTYAFTGVPDGTYVALAAFGIDGDVRDVSDTGNTAPVELVVRNGALLAPLGQFKLTGAVDLTSIDGVAVGGTGLPISAASSTPVFQWAKAAAYASAATFRIEVLDTFGNTVWAPAPQSASGSGPFTATYAGTPLQSGMFYQLRIQALDGGGIPLSQTEDLKGVFVKQ